jgi:hypothetical protein
MEKAPSTGEATFESILDLRCNVITSGTMARKQALVDAGLFESERVRAHDFHLWLRVAKKGYRIGYQRIPLLKYRVRVDSLSGDSVSRVEREINAFERVRRTIDLEPHEAEIVRRRIAGLESDLAVEQGKTFLIRGEYVEAAVAFRVANRHRRSIKLSAIGLLTRFAPGTLLRLYRSSRSADIELLPKAN